MAHHAVGPNGVAEYANHQPGKSGWSHPSPTTSPMTARSNKPMDTCRVMQLSDIPLETLAVYQPSSLSSVTCVSLVTLTSHCTASR